MKCSDAKIMDNMDRPTFTFKTSIYTELLATAAGRSGCALRSAPAAIERVKVVLLLQAASEVGVPPRPSGNDRIVATTAIQESGVSSAFI